MDTFELLKIVLNNLRIVDEILSNTANYCNNYQKFATADVIMHEKYELENLRALLIKTNDNKKK